MTSTRIKQIDHFFLKFGEFTSFFSIILVLMILAEVVARYMFSSSAAWLTELEWHVFALIFLFGTIFTLQFVAHWRVNVWYTRMSTKKQLWINLLCTMLFRLLWSLINIYTS